MSGPPSPAAPAAGPLPGGAAVARALSLALAPPDPPSLEVLGRLSAALAAHPPHPALSAPLAALAGAVPAPGDERGATDAAAEHESVFGRTVRLAPSEGSHERDPFRGTRRMADVAAFYRAFGAEVGGPLRERPDHVACELEFLAFLGLRREAALAEGAAAEAETCRAAEDAFLEAHLGAWLGPLCAAVPPLTQSPLLRAAAGLGERWIGLELAARGLAPRPLALRHERSGVEADELACGSCPMAAGEAPRGRGR